MKYQITYELEAENLNDATNAAYLLLFDTDADIDSVYVAPLPCNCADPIETDFADPMPLTHESKPIPMSNTPVTLHFVNAEYGDLFNPTIEDLNEAVKISFAGEGWTTHPVWGRPSADSEGRFTSGA